MFKKNEFLTFRIVYCVFVEMNLHQICKTAADS